MARNEKSEAAFRRNGFCGQLHMATTFFRNMMNSGLISHEDADEIHEAYKHIRTVLERWDKHYINKNWNKINGGG